jgi:hypothetical protein
VRVGIADGNLHFGMAWMAFAVALAMHVGDEASHDFLSTYNPAVRAIRGRFPFLPLPTFDFTTWIAGLAAGILLLLVLSPLAFHGNPWLRLLSLPLAIIVGILNAGGHFAGSVYFHRPMPGVYSAPVLLVAALALLGAAVHSG